MSLFTAIQGAGAGVNNPYIQQLQARQQQAQDLKVATPSKVEKIPGADTFAQELEAKAVQSVKRPSFSEMVERGVHNVDAKQKYAGNQVRMLMTGESDNLHQAMIAMEESGIAFNLMMETRNKLMTAYQELMRLRV